MPSYTLNVSTENAVRIKDALNAQFDWEDEEMTDLQKFKHWLRGCFTELVYRHERRQAEGAIAPDNGIADVT